MKFANRNAFWDRWQARIRNWQAWQHGQFLKIFKRFTREGSVQIFF